MKIIIADKISEQGIALLKETGWNVVLPAAAALGEEIADADALIVRSATKVTPGLLEKAKKLRAIGRAGVGVDNVDMDAATHRGVLVMNTPGGNAVSVAEHTIGLMLGLARSIPQLSASVQAGKWEKSGASGTELRGKTLGLVGFGRVGTEVARRARAFEMKVLAFDPSASAAMARELEVEIVGLEDLLRRADIVSLHTSLNSTSERMINKSSIALMKKGARIVNCARGELIDEAALAEALREGQIGGAALDTFAPEPPKDSPLLGLANVIATPHVAGSTREAQEHVGTAIAQQVRDYLADGLIRNAVNVPPVTAEQYRKLRPYVDLAQRLGMFAAQAAQATQARGLNRIRIRYAGEAAELGSQLIRSAVLVGVLNAGLKESEKVNVVNADEVAASRGLAVEESVRKRERGFPNTIEVAAVVDGREVAVEGAVVLEDATRIISVDGIALEAPLEGTLLLMRNRDVPGVIGQVGTALGSVGVNIATFALGRRQPSQGAEAVSLVRLDGKVDGAVVRNILAISPITEACLIRLPEEAAASAGVQ
ncbi:MAG TPA: phosphoglycerate dehydrogenase [Candidatus Acidoferrales bacterium]|nr:phosphoglycerate dehydrogenase [Candidatus Acidoferrales bacterium]